MMEEVNIPESDETLRRQQAQLIDSRRPAQMFPPGTKELSLPKGFKRIVLPRGVFHYDKMLVSTAALRRLSAAERENEILNLGPYNKRDVLARMVPGEVEFAIVEWDWDGVELRCAATCEALFPEQYHYFYSTKEPNSKVMLEPTSYVLYRRTTAPASPTANPAGTPGDNTSPHPSQ